RVQESDLPRAARLVEPQPEDRLSHNDGDAAPGRRAQVRAVRRGLATGRPDLGPPGLYPSNEGRLAPDFGRLRRRDLPSQLREIDPAPAAASRTRAIGDNNGGCSQRESGGCKGGPSSPPLRPIKKAVRILLHAVTPR